MNSDRGMRRAWIVESSDRKQGIASNDNTEHRKGNTWSNYLPAVTALLRSTVTLLRGTVAALLGLESRLLVATVSALLVSTLLTESAALLVTALLTTCEYKETVLCE